MDKYVNKIKSALNRALEDILAKKENVTLSSGHLLQLIKVVEVSITDLTELKLLDFIGGRKFEVSGKGIFNAWEKVGDGELLKSIEFGFTRALVKFHDTSQSFEVSEIGKFTAMNFTKP